MLSKCHLPGSAAVRVIATLVLAAALISVGRQPQSVHADATYQPLPFAQDWSSADLITTDDDWSGVPGIVGYRGDGLTTVTGVDPQTVVADGSATPVDVIANQTAPETLTTGGIAEFALDNPVVALQGSGTASAPFLLLHLDTTGQTNIKVSYTLRDIDGSDDDAVQPVALQYRAGTTGDFTNIAAAYVADAASGPGQAAQATPVSVTLPVAAENQAQLQLRIITTDAAGSDEWIGVDDIAVTSATPMVEACAATTVTPISQIQGSGDASPLVGQTVTISGTVVGDFQGDTGLDGFFVQDTGDGDPLTSDGVFVFTPAANSFASTNVATGDVVQVTGEVKEFNTLTEIDFVSALDVCAAASATPVAPVTVTLPETTNGDLERYEGMLVTISDTLTVSQNFFLGRYGQVALSSGGRLFNPTNGNGLGENDADNQRRLLVLDDGSSDQNPNPIPYIGADSTLRTGDTVSNLTGVLDYGAVSPGSNPDREYRLQPTIAPTFARTNPRTAAPDDVGGEVRVASFNVLNYFTTIDEAGAACFPSNTRSDCRGADSAEESSRQSTKIITALAAIDADVVGLIEIENNGDTAVNDIVSKLNATVGADTYAAIADPANLRSVPGGDDAIKVALIYKPSAVTPISASLVLSDTAFTIGRAPVGQVFETTGDSERFSVIVNHFKSKGCGGASGADEDQGDGQGCYNATRVAQAQALAAFVGDVQAAAQDDDVLVVGDLNAYGAEDPIATLTSAGLTNQVAAKVPATERYSYVFSPGQSGYLDHALTTPSLDPQVSGVTIWHINADEPSVINYNTEFKPEDLYTPTPYASSDHDPVVVGLNLGASSSDGATLFLPLVIR